MAALAHTWGGPRTPSMGALHTLTSRSLPGALANTILPPRDPRSPLSFSWMTIPHHLLWKSARP